MNGVYDLKIASAEQVLAEVGNFLIAGEPAKALVMYVGWLNDQRIQRTADKIVTILKKEKGDTK